MLFVSFSDLFDYILKELIPTLTDEKKREFNGHLNYVKKDLEQLEDEHVKLTGEIDDLNSRLEDLTIQKGGKINKKRKTNKRRHKKHNLKKEKQINVNTNYCFIIVFLLENLFVFHLMFEDILL